VCPLVLVAWLKLVCVREGTLLVPLSESLSSPSSSSSSLVLPLPPSITTSTRRRPGATPSTAHEHDSTAAGLRALEAALLRLVEIETPGNGKGYGGQEGLLEEAGSGVCSEHGWGGRGTGEIGLAANRGREGGAWRSRDVEWMERKMASLVGKLDAAESVSLEEWGLGREGVRDGWSEGWME